MIGHLLGTNGVKEKGYDERLDVQHAVVEYRPSIRFAACVHCGRQKEADCISTNHCRPSRRWFDADVRVMADVLVEIFPNRFGLFQRLIFLHRQLELVDRAIVEANVEMEAIMANGFDQGGFHRSHLHVWFLQGFTGDCQFGLQSVANLIDA